ncbi:MAG: sulfite exporter TauE/SafE family protein [Phycisphaerales bacterium]
MMPLIGAVLIASLLGSLHCAGMCGAFVLFAVSGPDGPSSAVPRSWLHGAYHAGRLMVYVVLGAAAGATGAALDLAGSLVGLQRVACIGAGALMMAVGIITILRVRGVRLAHFGVPRVFERWLMAGHRAAHGLSPVARALVTGLLTTLLPCGWLYAFVITAAGTASAGWGALTMAAFWVGTLPVLIGVGTLAQRATGALGRHLPVVTATLVAVVGLFTVIDRAGLMSRTIGMLDPGTPLSAEQALARAVSGEASQGECHGAP